MKTKNVITSLLLVFAMLFTASCTPKDWAVKIDDEVISIKEFLNLYYTQNKLMFGKDKKEVDKLAKDTSAMHPAYKQFLDKEMFLEFVINRKLIYRKAMDDKSIDQEELKAVLMLYRMQQVMAFFLKEKLKDDIKITDDDIDRFYKKNQRRFVGVPLNDKVVEQIKLRLQMQELEKKSASYVKKLIEQSKIDKKPFNEYSKGKKKKGWIVKIDSDEITVKEFETYYYTQHKIMMNMSKEEIDKAAKDPAMTKRYQTLDKEHYFEQLIRAHLVYKKAMAELEKSELKSVMELINLQAVPAYYLSTKMKDKVKATDDEIMQYYNKYRTRAKFLAGKPLNDRTKSLIKRRITQQKFEYQSQKFILQLKEESRIYSEGLKNYLKNQKKKEENKKDTKKDDKKK